jgi:hypothetical protein
MDMKIASDILLQTALLRKPLKPMGAVVAILSV